MLTIAGRHGVGDHLAMVMQDHAVNVRSVVAEDSGHFVAEEVPELFCGQLAGFLAA